MSGSDYLERDDRVISQVYSRDPLVMTRGDGMYLQDIDGKRYLDFSAHYSSCCLGHAHPKLNRVISEQLGIITSLSAQFSSRERVHLAEDLLAAAGHPYKKVLLGCTGSDANEFALKAAKVRSGGGAIVSFWRGYHGATAGSAAATGKAETIQTNTGIAELLPSGFLHVAPPYCYRCDYNKTFPECGLFCISFIRTRLAQDGISRPAGIIIEPVQAAGGVIVPPPGFAEALRALCTDLGCPLIYDEVVTGMGRTGKLFAFMHGPVRPDILVIGKALTGGYIPGSAVLMDRKTADAIDDLTLHGHTHSAYPLMCAAASATLEIIRDEDLCVNARNIGNFMLDELRLLQEQYEPLGDVRGIGLLIGLEIVKNRESRKPDHTLAEQIYTNLRNEGVITELESSPRLGSSVIVLHPPLIINREHAEDFIAILSRVLKKTIA